MSLFLPEVKELLAEKDLDSLLTLLQELSPVDIVELIESLPESSQIAIFNLLPLETACDVFEHMEPQDAVSFLKLLSEPKAVEILNEMAPDERADLFASLPEEEAQHFLKLMETEEAQDVEELITYPPDTAGGIMTTEFAWIPVNLTVAKAIDFLRTEEHDFDFYQVYVLQEKKLLGTVSIRELIVSPSNTLVEEMMQNIPTVPTDMDQEEVARLIAKHDLTSIPVVNEREELRGIITVDDVVDVIEDESTEDMQMFGGSAPLARNYVDTSAFGVAKSRFPWLVLLLLASFVSGFVIQKFSTALQAMINLAIFIPVLLNCSGNAGMQAASVVIRGLATGEIKFTHILGVIKKEFLIGILMGIGLGVLVALRSLPVEQSLSFGFVVGISMTAGIIIATTVGTLLPIIFQKLGFDPALMSGPLLTTFMDITSLLIYFSIAVKMLGI